MLDLEARVDLEEEELLGLLVVEELDGARVAVPDGTCHGLRRREHLAPHLGRQIWRRRLLDDLLVAALHRAVTLCQRDDVVCRAKDLHLDVTRVLDVLLEEHAAVAEVCRGKVLHRGKGRAQLVIVVADAHADAATAGRALEHDGVADAMCRPHRLISTCDEARTGEQGDARLLCQLARDVLEPKALDLLWGRADEGDARSSAGTCELNVLRQEPVSWVNCLGSGLARRRKHLVYIEVRICCRAIPEVDSFVGVLHMQTVLICFGVDGHAFHPHARERALDAGGDGSSVGDKDFREHGALSFFPAGTARSCAIRRPR